jgi:hypothetical protein
VTPQQEGGGVRATSCSAREGRLCAVGAYLDYTRASTPNGGSGGKANLLRRGVVRRVAHPGSRAPSVA